jgi:hypothetical protein
MDRGKIVAGRQNQGAKGINPFDHREIDLQEAESFGQKVNLSLPGTTPPNPFAGHYPGHPDGRLVFVQLARRELQDKHLFFPHVQKAGKVFFFYDMPFAKSRSLELSRDDLSEIVGQSFSHGLLYSNFLKHKFPLV